MRKLASIQRVAAIEPIDGADKIELARIEGWQCVVQKGQFHPGDLGVYFEIDSFLPISPGFGFLAKSCLVHSPILGDGYRLRTMKMRGVLSQGLLMPLYSFPAISGGAVGDDVTEALGVREWTTPIPAELAGEFIGPRPSIIPYSDETRVQVGGEALINEFDGLKYYITTKMDGSSHGICVDKNGIFHASSHRMELKDNGRGFWKFIHERHLDKKLIDLRNAMGYETIAAVGEYCGPGIQGNRIGLDHPQWYIFTVEIDGKRVSLPWMELVADAINQRMVPVEERGESFNRIYPSVDAVLARADGEYSEGRRKEGIVIRPIEPVMSNIIGGYLSMKAVSNKYLLKSGT